MSGWQETEPDCVVGDQNFDEHDYEIHDNKVVNNMHAVDKSKCSRCGVIERHTVDSYNEIDEFVYKK